MTPISRKQFESGLTDDMTEWTTLIHEFLGQHRDEAYAEQELRQEVKAQRTIRFVVGHPPASEEPKEGRQRGVKIETTAGPESKEQRKAFGAALRRLVALTAVETKLAGGLQYYAYKQELPK